MRLQTLITLILLFSFFINAQEYQKEPEEKEKFRRAELKRAMKKFDVSSNQVTKSDGSIDADSYTWSDSAVNDLYNQCAIGLTWWADKARDYGISLSFFLYYYF